MLDYETRKQQRIERYKELSDKNKILSNQKAEQAHKMAEIIPLGQPIIVGHYSEKRDRNYRERISNTFGKAVELGKKADYYADKAESAESNSSISSDDPEAIKKLKEKIAEAEEKQKNMVTFNKLLRKKDIDGMLKAGFSQSVINARMEPNCFGGLGYPQFELTNNNANIRRMKERLAYLEKHSNDVTSEQTIGDIKIIDNVELNRLQVIFPGKPSEEVRSELKSNGFRWSPTEGAWQRQRSKYAKYSAFNIANKLNCEGTKCQ